MTASLVVASAYGPAAASTRVRVLDWLRHLGVDAEILRYMGTANVRPGTLLRRPLDVLRAEAALRSRRRDPERLLISRSMGPFTAGRVEAALLRRAQWGVYDFDDALFADDRGGIYRYFGEATAWKPSVCAADLVVAGNDYLAEAASAHNSRVTVIPSCVAPDSYPQKREYALGEVPRLVWLGSPSTERFLQSIAPALLQVHRTTGARLTVISAGDASLGELSAMTDRVAWAGPLTDALLATADVGLMPLPDTPFTRGKCAYKLLQYGAAALPAVASPVGVNATVIEQLHGTAARRPDEWADAVQALLRAPETERRARGTAARAAVEKHYSYAAWADAFRKALQLD
jgi:glycosyltransferase involved in cell wall biosynthesis